MVKIEELKNGRYKVVDGCETFEISYKTFKSIYKFMVKTETKHELKRLIQEFMDDMPIDDKNVLLCSNEILDVMVDKIICKRTANENADQVMDIFDDVITEKVIDAQRKNLYKRFVDRLNANEKAKLHIKKKNLKDESKRYEYEQYLFSETISYMTGYSINMDEAIDWLIEDLAKKAKK